MVFQRFGGKGSLAEFIYESMTNEFLEQPQLHRDLLHQDLKKIFFCELCNFWNTHLAENISNLGQI